MARSKEDIEWEKSEGIPQVGDSFIQKYFNGRNALIEQEHKQRHGQILHNFIRPFSLSLFSRDSAHATIPLTRFYRLCVP
jgi:hypothetical protein